MPGSSTPSNGLVDEGQHVPLLAGRAEAIFQFARPRSVRPVESVPGALNATIISASQLSRAQAPRGLVLCARGCHDHSRFSTAFPHPPGRSSTLADVYRENANLLAAALPFKIRPGQRVAVAVGSRGIANVATIVRATLDVLQGCGAMPFVVAAMGSHGGATAEGQRQLLAEYGVSEEVLAVPVKIDMATVTLGTNSWGEPVFCSEPMRC